MEDYITVTKEHLLLLKRMYVSWWSCEYGAPSIDCKRPYGNGDVENDICEILGKKKVKVDYDESYLTEDLEYAARIHKEMETVLQVVLRFLSFEEKTYVRKNGWSNWEVKK